MGIKTQTDCTFVRFATALKNLPTTWGLRLLFKGWVRVLHPLKNLPTTWGLRPRKKFILAKFSASEKPPHHMGIKTMLVHLMSVQLSL